MRYVSPLRYPGGKSQLTNFMKSIFALNNLNGGHYVELYAGGASLGLHLLFGGHADHIHINDLNSSVFAFWNSVINDTENLCRRIRDTPVDMDHWRLQRAVQENPTQFSTLELGFSTFFLNRTNRSGIIMGGVIGGKEQNGDWLLDVRYNKTKLIERIEKIAENKDHITLHNRDALELLQELSTKLPEKSLIYLDPPYYSKGRRLYTNNYHHDDHATVAAAIKQINRRWIVSYDNVARIRKLYEGFDKIAYRLSYSANDHYLGSEVIFFCPGLIIPATKNPAKYKPVDLHSIPLQT